MAIVCVDTKKYIKKKVLSSTLSSNAVEEGLTPDNASSESSTPANAIGEGSTLENATGESLIAGNSTGEDSTPGNTAGEERIRPLETPPERFLCLAMTL